MLCYKHQQIAGYLAKDRNGKGKKTPKGTYENESQDEKNFLEKFKTVSNFSNQINPNE